jgi:hypothetical protein
MFIDKFYYYYNMIILITFFCFQAHEARSGANLGMPPSSPPIATRARLLF